MKRWKNEKHELIITKHSKQRCKSRLGIKKKSINPLIKKVLKKGLKYYQLNGKLRDYVTYLYKSHDKIPNNILIYNRDVFIFKNKKLLTVFHLPRNLYKSYDNIQNKLKKENE